MADTPTDVGTARSTAPQSPYTIADVRIGLVVFLLGVAIAFLMPLVAL